MRGIELGQQKHGIQDHTRTVSGRKPFNSSVKALRSTTHARKSKDPNKGKVTTVPWAFDMAKRQQTQMFWKEADKKVLRVNKKAAWGFQPKGHPSSKSYTPRTKLQKRQAASNLLKDTPEGRKRNDPQFSSDEPLHRVMHSTNLMYPKRRNDMISLEADSGAAQASLAQKKQGQILMEQKLSRQSKRRPRTAAEIRTPGAPSFSGGNRNEQPHGRSSSVADSLFTSNQPLIDTGVNPPCLADVAKDRSRNLRLQNAKSAWSNAERLLSLNCKPDEIFEAFKVAQGHFQSVGNATPRELQGPATFAPSNGCTRYS